MRVTTVVRVLAYTAIGVVLTVATSFGFAFQSRYDSRPELFLPRIPPPRNQHAIVLRWDRLGSTFWLRWPSTLIEDFDRTAGIHHLTEVEGSWVRPSVDWSESASPTGSPTESIRAFGFPMLALSWHRRASRPLPALEGGYAFSPVDLWTAFVDVNQSSKRLVFSDQAGVLPLTPIWMGIIVNTAFYAVGCALLVLSIRGATRMTVGANRCRGGRCVKCGYSRKNLPSATCPECGWVENPKA